MGSKPKKQEYEASESEKISASVAMADKNAFDRKYGRLLKNMRDQSKSDDPTRALRGRANADTMQALTNDLSFRNTQELDRSGEIANAAVGQLGQAGAKGAGIQNQLRTNVLGIARQQSADAASGLADAARMETSTQLNNAQAKQMERNARNAAAAQIAGSALITGINNKRTKGMKAPTDADGNRLAGPPQQVQGSFFTPVNSQGQQALGIVNRMNQSGTIYDPSNPFSPFRSN
jgi:hypothetical protein